MLAGQSQTQGPYKFGLLKIHDLPEQEGESKETKEKSCTREPENGRQFPKPELDCTAQSVGAPLQQTMSLCLCALLILFGVSLSFSLSLEME